MQAYYINIQELSDLLFEIDLMLNNDVDENTKIVNVIDLYLEAITGNTAIIRVSMTKGKRPLGIGLFNTPSEPVWAARKLGDCAIGNGGYDGADFLRAYANAQAPHNQLTCSTGTKKYIVITSTFDTKQIMDFYYPASIHYGLSLPSGTQVTQYYSQFIMPNSWYSVNNQCIGYTNLEWFSRYAKMSFLISTNLTTAVYLNSSAEFISTDYKSNTGNSNPFPPLINYYHAGNFYYGVVFCN